MGMLTKFGIPLYLDHKVEINVIVRDAMIWNESPVVEGLVVQCFRISCDEFIEIVGERWSHPRTRSSSLPFL